MMIKLATDWLRAHRVVRILLRVVLGFGRMALMMGATSILFPQNDPQSLLNMLVVSFCLVGFVDTTLLVHTLRQMDREEAKKDAALAQSSRPPVIEIQEPKSAFLVPLSEPIASSKAG